MLILVSFFLGLLTVRAQSSFSIEGGLNLSTVKFSGFERFEPLSRSGYFISLRHQTSFSEKWAFNSELQYSQDGYRIFPEHEIDTRYQFLRLLPQIEYKPHPKIGFLAGLNVGVNLKKETRQYKGDWFTIPIDDSINDYDFGFIIGGKYYLKKFTFSFRYNHGLSKTTEFTFTGENGETLGDTFGQNRSIQIGVGYAFLNFGKKES